MIARLKRVLAWLFGAGEQPDGWFLHGDTFIPYWGPRRPGDGLYPEVTE